MEEIKRKSMGTNNDDKSNIRGMTQSKKDVFKFNTFHIERDAFLDCTH